MKSKNDENYYPAYKRKIVDVSGAGDAVIATAALSLAKNLDFNLFMDLANVWEVDYDSSLDSNKIRSSTGVAVNWFSPIGPLSFSYAIPISDADTDITENFRFQIGTSF